MTGKQLLQYLKALPATERKKQIMLSNGPLQALPLLEIDEADPDNIYLRNWVESGSEN